MEFLFCAKLVSLSGHYNSNFVRSKTILVWVFSQVVLKTRIQVQILYLEGDSMHDTLARKRRNDRGKERQSREKVYY